LIRCHFSVYRFFRIIVIGVSLHQSKHPFPQFFCESFGFSIYWSKLSDIEFGWRNDFWPVFEYVAESICLLVLHGLLDLPFIEVDCGSFFFFRFCWPFCRHPTSSEWTRAFSALLDITVLNFDWRGNIPFITSFTFFINYDRFMAIVLLDDDV
jgi:hypothetical protein